MNTPNWLVRPPKLTDVAALAAIASAVSQPHAPLDPSQISWSMDQLDGRFWTITVQDQPIGYAALLPLPGLPYLFELTGGIDPQFQRQGVGSYLWQTMRDDVGGTAVQEVTYTVTSLDTATAHFLRHHQFSLEHEEWTLQLDNLLAAELRPADLPGSLVRIDQETAVRTLPKLYERGFTGTPWFQPYTNAEVAATWEANDELHTLVVDDQIIGFVWLHFPEPTVAEIEPIGIIKEKQGVGYGRFLLTTTLQYLQNQEVQTVSLGVWTNNQVAIQLYQSLGFTYRRSSYSLTYTLSPK